MSEQAQAVRTRGSRLISPYEAWLDGQGVPVVRGHGITDLGEPAFGYWEHLGAEAYFVQLQGMEGFTGMYVAQLPAGGATNLERHLYEKIVYVLQGRGSTTLEGPDGGSVQFEWQEGSLFAIPLNTPHRFFAHAEPVRFAAITTAPVMFDFLHSAEFIHGAPFAFRDRFDGRPDFMHHDVRNEEENDTLLGMFSRRGWETNFVADARTVLPDKVDATRRSLRYIVYEFAGNSLIAHESKYPTGSYMQGHYHGGGAILLILRSHGYSLMWPNSLGHRPFESGFGDQVVRMDWRPGAVFSPPTGWYHQHFNTGPEDALQLAFRYGSTKFPVGFWLALGGGEQDNGMTATMKSRREGGHIIPYEDEDPAMRQMYHEAIARNGITAWER